MSLRDRRFWRPGVRYLGLLAAAALCGCSGPEGLRPYIGEESVLRHLLPPTPGEAAEMAADPYDPGKRYRGTLALANQGFVDPTPFVEMFEANIVDHDARVRAAAARGLANHGRPRHAMMLVAALDDREAIVRREAARGLQRLHNPEAVDALLRASDDDQEPDEDVRIEAAYALGQYPQTRVFEALKKALWDRSLAVNTAAASSLRYLTGQDLGTSIRAWDTWGAQASDLFAGQLEYRYPIFQRDRRLLEYVPFWPPPPNEDAAAPAGLPRLDG
ncbi:MAG: HEAT repeat domain-containing protein [Phycisphaerales bacterium JB039]